MSARACSATVLAVVALVASAAASGLTAGPAAAAPAGADRLLGTTQYLARSQLRSGDLHPPAPLMVDGASTQAWGALGLAAGKVNAALQREVPEATTLYASLESNVELLGSTGDRALMLLVEPTVHDLRNDDGTKGYRVELLVNAVLSGQVTAGPDAGGFAWQSPGSVGADARSTALAALALTGVRDDPHVRVAVGDPIINAVSWLGVRGTSGTWPKLGETTPDTETSALAVEAIQASGVNLPAARAAVSAFGSWMQQRQNADGGFGTGAPGAPSDLIATATAARALTATGTAPSEFRHAETGATPIDFLGAAQDPVDHRLGTDDPVRTTGYAALAFAGASLPLGHVTGTYGVGSRPPQPVPSNLPTGPILPVEVPVTPPSLPAPAPPPATAPAPAPTLRPAATAPARVPATVRQIKNTKKLPAGNGGSGDAGSGSGSGGGGGTLATSGAPDRAGGGGGTGTSVTAAASIPAGAVAAPTPRATRRGGTPTKATGDAPREVRGTLIGRDSATPGAAGSRVATPGAAGASAGHTPTPWWAIALALTILAGIAGGVRLDRRTPELAL